MNPMPASNPAFRLWHQFILEWRAQWFLVFTWLVALAINCWQSLQDQPTDITLPDSLPALLALIVIVRSVRLDAPGNTETTSHTRPLGRGVVWMAKVLFFMVALLLPWLACAWPVCHGYGFGAAEWLAELTGRFVSALWIGSLTALSASWSGSSRKNGALIGAGVVVAGGFYWLLHERNICAAAVAKGVLSATLLLAWWQVSLSRRAWPTLAVGGALAVAAAFCWPWNWTVRPEARFVETKLGISIGQRPEGLCQELWQGVYLTGLPADHVASIVSFAPADAPLVFSDYSGVTQQSGRRTPHSRWMTMNHTQALVAHYPAGSLWHGDADLAREPALKKIVEGDAAKPWHLRLSVQKMRRIISMPLASTRKLQEVVIHPGLRLDFKLSALNDNNQMRIWTMLRRCVPELLPQDDYASLKTGGKNPEPNIIALLSSPALREVCVTHKDDFFAEPPVIFTFPHPRPTMEIAGLKLDDWIAGTTLDLWWPEERGVVDLEISAEELRRAMEGR